LTSEDFCSYFGFFEDAAPRFRSRRARHRRRVARAMKVTALSLWKWNGDKAEPTCLGKAEDVAEFGYFQRGSVREMLTFISRTIVKRTQPGQRQSVEQDQYLVHVTNRGGLVAIAVMDREYPSRSAFCVLSKMSDDYVARVGDAWKTVASDDARGDAILAEAIAKYQDPMEADKILKIQRELDETKVVLHKTIDSVLARGEKLDNLVDKSTDLSLASQMFYKQAKKQNQCCTMM
jgi:synaptobrevin family protein YKT6